MDTEADNSAEALEPEEVEIDEDFEKFEQQADEAEDESDDDDTQDEAEAEAAPDEADAGLEDVEIDGKTYKVPKDAALRQADYTRKTMELAEKGKVVEATLERLQSVSQAETQALAGVAIISAQLKQYEDVDWDAWEEQDAQLGTREAQKHWRIFQGLKEQQATAVQNYTNVGEAKRSVVQQETAKRLEEADRIAAQRIPGWNGDKAKATLDFSRTTYNLTNDELMSAISEKPEVIELLHDAMEYRKSLKKTAVKAKIEKQQAVKPATVLKGNSGRVGFNPSTTNFADFEKHANKR